MPTIGQSVNRLDAESKVKGEANFASDLHFPNQLHLKILFAGRPHAKILRIDTAQAEGIKGVVAIFTAKDVPVNECGNVINDQPVLCGPGSNIPFSDRVRFVGDKVAVIVAETESIAVDARDHIIVTYEDMPVVSNVHEAIQPGAPLLHPAHEGNILKHHKIRSGDVEAAFSQADVIIESDYHTPAQEHAYLETEAGVGYIDEDGRVTVVVNGQWPHKDRSQIAHALNLPEDMVRVIYPPIGGAFGGREDISVQIVLALAAWRLHQRGIKRPIKTTWSREESILGHAKRHPYHIYTRWGATRNGKVIAAEVKMIADAGAYASQSTYVSGFAMHHLLSVKE